MKEMQPCAWCGKQPYRKPDMTYRCDDDACLNAMYYGLDWNEYQKMLRDRRRQDFEAGISACMKGRFWDSMRSMFHEVNYAWNNHSANNSDKERFR